jgi:hypothetical protein
VAAVGALAVSALGAVLALVYPLILAAIIIGLCRTAKHR